MGGNNGMQMIFNVNSKEFPIITTISGKQQHDKCFLIHTASQSYKVTKYMYSSAVHKYSFKYSISKYCTFYSDTLMSLVTLQIPNPKR